jgi:hypothetical protein
MTTDDNKLSVTAHWDGVTGHFSNAFLFSGDTAVLFIRALVVTQDIHHIKVADEHDPTWSMAFSHDHFSQQYIAKTSPHCTLFSIAKRPPEHPDLSWTCQCGGDMYDGNGPWICQDCDACWDHESAPEELGSPGTSRYNLKYLGKGADQ